MSNPNQWSRRKLLVASIVSLTPKLAWAQAEAVDVLRDPSCGCCGGWVDHLKLAGLTVNVEERSDLDPIKRRLGIPEELWACHTATVGGYAVEGHVPAHAIARLLAERPGFKGVAVPGMPIGSPGMESGDHEDVFEVIGFDGSMRFSFGRYRGSRPV